jgi:hypothetical protein
MESSKGSIACQKETKYSQNKRFKKVEEKIKEEKTMSEFTILKRLQRLENFIGCFPCDVIPKCSNFPSLFILNTDSSNLKGTHWFAVREDETTVEVFDSLKLKKYSPEIKEYLSQKKMFANLYPVEFECGGKKVIFPNVTILSRWVRK